MAHDEDSRDLPGGAPAPSRQGEAMSLSDRDLLRADQTKRLLNLASRMLEYMRGGLSETNCQAVCELMLPETQAMCVAMTDDTYVLGFAGRYAEDFPLGSPIHTDATHEVLRTKKAQVFSLSRSVGTHGLKVIPAGVVAPLIVRDQAVGTLKLYFEAPEQVDDTQIAIATGLAELLSTQLSMSELDRQIELTTKAELQALQAQINPHFLFNTINTISSLVRTDPMRARDLLREFAKFYRQTLENSDGLIPLSREIEQTRRYLGFEVARFGEERIRYRFDVEGGLDKLEVPSFLIQPVVENSINHAMQPGKPLNILVVVRTEGDDVVIEVQDDGVGMDEHTLARLLEEKKPTKSGSGIALNNVHARLRACFAQGSGITATSELGVGTTVTLHLCGVARSCRGGSGAASEGAPSGK
ncbi:MAG: histidine kinase [Coriobacteriales bacterium]|jgi:two-component system sensor histidine kinase LytS